MSIIFRFIDAPTEYNFSRLKIVQIIFSKPVRKEYLCYQHNIDIRKISNEKAATDEPKQINRQEKAQP